MFFKIPRVPFFSAAKSSSKEGDEEHAGKHQKSSDAPVFDVGLPEKEPAQEDSKENAASFNGHHVHGRGIDYCQTVKTDVDHQQGTEPDSLSGAKPQFLRSVAPV